MILERSSPTISRHYSTAEGMFMFHTVPPSTRTRFSQISGLKINGMLELAIAALTVSEPN